LFSGREPRTGGKTLTEWSQQYGSNHWSGNRVADLEAQAEIRAIGTNAIPFLLKQVAARNSPLKGKLARYLPKQWQSHPLLRADAEETRRAGAHGLAALGTNAAAAVPKLIQLATEHPDEDGRYSAVFALRTLAPASEPAIPLLIQCLTNSSAFIRDDAAMALGAIGRQPDVVVPALVEFVSHNDEVTRLRSTANTFELTDGMTALAKFGAQSNSLPVMLSLLEHPNSYVREAASNYFLPLITNAVERPSP
jgi:HEAT repeat protein